MPTAATQATVNRRQCYLAHAAACVTDQQQACACDKRLNPIGRIAQLHDIFEKVASPALLPCRTAHRCLVSPTQQLTMRATSVCAFITIVALLACAWGAEAAKDPKECEVCISVLEGIDKMLKPEDKKSVEKIESTVQKYCRQKSLHPKEKKVCYEIESIQREVSRPLSIGMPPRDVCMRKLSRKSSVVCAVRYPVEVDENTDYSKLRVRELRALLAERGIACVGCVEKDDFVRKLTASDAGGRARSEL